MADPIVYPESKELLHPVETVEALPVVQVPEQPIPVQPESQPGLLPQEQVNPPVAVLPADLVQPVLNQADVPAAAELPASTVDIGMAIEMTSADPNGEKLTGLAELVAQAIAANNPGEAAA